VVNPAFIMLPLMVTEYFKGGPLHLGMLESAFGFGMIAGGLLMGVWGGFRKKIVTALVGVVAMGFAIMLIGFTPADAFFMAVISVGAAGVMNTIENASFFAIFQTKVEPHMQGRVFTAMQSAIIAVVPLSLLVIGPLVDRFGVSVFFVIAGICSMIFGGLSLFVPAILRIEENGHKEDETHDDDNEKGIELGSGVILTAIDD
ncbi:MAG: MFS transporter, partial [Anaerolineaceae bacterium]|nr:MFS transporter [Anaerolineaceae bacterium]